MNAQTVQLTLRLTASEVLTLLNAVDTYHASRLKDRLEAYGAASPEDLSEARARRVRDAVDAAALAVSQPRRAVS